MADLTSPPSSPPQQSPPASSPQPAGGGGETQWSLALKAIFWFILLPIGLVYLMKWLLLLR